MAEQSISKRCCTCKQIKPLSEFVKNRSTKNGYASDCKTCRRQYRQTEKAKQAQKRSDLKYRKSPKRKAWLNEYRQTEKGNKVLKRAVRKYSQSEKGKAYHRNYCIVHPEQRRAKNAVLCAIRSGKLPRPDTLKCYYCPAQAKDYHHHKGYTPEHYLDVIPVCQKCHNKIPKEISHE